MSRLLQILTLLAFVVLARPASAFSLGGPLGGAPGGEAWQDFRHGYSDVGNGYNGAIMSPKNLTHEYRRNVPFLTYAFDLTFINYFGTNGINAVEAAMEILNDLPDVDTLSSNLVEYPLDDPITGATTTFRDSRRVNFTAQALNLLDLKSQTLGFMIEQLGLISPERYTWTLRSRITSGPLPITNYSTIMRNFDPVTLMPSAYVNGNRYTYEILEFFNGTLSDAIEFPADPESSLYGFSSVANIIASEGFELPSGVFYTYLTRDDIGGLRYIYQRDNLNYESFAPNTQIFGSDPGALTLLTNIDLFTFSSFTRFNPPAVVQAAFPDLVIRSSSVSITTEVQVVDVVLTNERPPWGDPFTTYFSLIPILQTNPVLVYDYVFANVITNYSSPTTRVRTITSGFVREPWSTPDNPIFRTNITEEVVNLPSGGIIIVPPNIGRYEFIPGQTFTTIITNTNSFFTTNIVDNGIIRPISAAEVTFFTNTIYGVFPFTLQDPPISVLRGGVGKVTFQRLTNAIFTGTNFVHTNSFTAVFMTNRFGVPTLVTNEFRRLADQPDILFRAADLGVVSPSGAPVLSERSISLESDAEINSAFPAGVGGPGIIYGPNVISYSNTGPALFNVLPGTATEESAGVLQGFLWGVFDGSTNAPVVFPKDLTLEDVSLIITGGITNP
ncbi:MAG TPA: hypothetical protein VF773_09285 [Verrucomicrobiae bacterium]